MVRTKAKESEIQKAIMEYLTLKKIWHMRLNTGAMFGTHKGKRWAVRFGKPGMADILVTFGHGTTCFRVVWLEVKNASGKQSEDQQNFQREVEHSGHFYRIVRSLDDVVELFERA